MLTTRRMRTTTIAFLFLLGPSKTTSASVIQFTDQNAWDTAAGSPITLSFGPLNPGDPLNTNLGVGPVALGPLTFTAEGQYVFTDEPPQFSQYNTLQAISGRSRDTCPQGITCLISYDAGDDARGDEFSNASVDIGLPAGTYAFGITLNAIDTEPTGTFVITVPSLGTAYNITVPNLDSVFFGIVSSEPFSDVNITENYNYGLGPFSMVNPSFATLETSAVPEAKGGAWLTLFVLLLTALVRRPRIGPLNLQRRQAMGSRGLEEVLPICSRVGK